MKDLQPRGGVPFISRGESQWEFEDNTDSGGVKVGLVSYQSGTLILRDPSGKRYSFAYRGLGPAYGLEIHLPMKIPSSKLFWLSVKDLGLTKGVRRAINKLGERIGLASSAGGGYTADKANQGLPESVHPTKGTILVGPACTGNDLTLEDFGGWCIFCTADAGLIYGSYAAGMLMGLSAIKKEWWGDGPKESQLPYLFGQRDSVGVNILGTIPNMASPMLLAMGAVEQAKALILFAGANFDFRAGSGVSAQLGYANLIPKQIPGGDILQMEWQIFKETIQPEGPETA